MRKYHKEFEYFVLESGVQYQVLQLSYNQKLWTQNAYVVHHTPALVVGLPWWWYDWWDQKRHHDSTINKTTSIQVSAYYKSGKNTWSLVKMNRCLLTSIFFIYNGLPGPNDKKCLFCQTWRGWLHAVWLCIMWVWFWRQKLKMSEQTSQYGKARNDNTWWWWIVHRHNISNRNVGNNAEKAKFERQQGLLELIATTIWV